MMKRYFYILAILFTTLLLSVITSISFAQVLLTSPGTSYTNTDAVTTDTYGPVNASCGYVTFTIDYSSSLPWAGSGNMEAASECSGCNADPTNPSASCATCWDFFYVEYLVGGVVVGTDLVGAGNDVQNASFSFTHCLSAPSSVSMNVYTQTWAADETMSFSNIEISCGSINPNESSINTSCGQSNGQACVAPTGGAASYTYVWSTGATTACLNNIVAGNYDVTITDDNGCTQTETVIVTNTNAIINSNESSTNTNCGQSNGQACVAPTGGTAPYTYVWSTGATTACLNNIAAGNYDVTITDDNGCTKTETINVTNTNAIINSNESSTNTNCGQSNGQACVTPTGGTAPYTYVWNTGATTACLNNIAAGNYNVTITDDNGCTKTETVNITNTNATINSNESSTNTNCGQSNGQACVAPTGGTAPYTYVWNTGATTACLNNIAAGNYNVTITDDNGCTQTETVNVTNTGATILSNESSTNTNCGQSNGQACVAPTGGTAPYTYVWANGATTACLNNIAAGNYNVTITDDNGCMQTETVNVTNTNAIINANESSNNTNCGQSNGQACVAPTGGTAPYTYVWNTGATTACLNNIAAGNYNVTITDDNGCTQTETVNVANTGATILSNESSTNTNCGQNNGQACVAPTGGTAPYTYVWNTGATTACLNNIAAGNYNVTITDDNGCTQTETVNVANTGATINANESSTNTNCGQSNGQACVAPTGGTAPYTYVWNTGATTACLNNIAAGNYDVTITDDNGCTKTETINVTNTNAIINSNESSNNTNCGQSNGQACVAPTGGTAPYTYVWNTGATTACLNNIAAGNYNVTITDDNGCTQTETVNVTNTNANINANESSTNTNCGQSNGQACVAPTGGTAPYTYVWNTGATTACLNNIAAGNYNVTITDDNGCTQTETVNVTNTNANINANESSTNTNCGQSNGQACVGPTGGTAPYTYLWANGATTACLNNIAAGNYNVTITDDNNCTQTETVNVANTGATILSNESSTNTNCGQSNGQACVAPTGGTAPYTYVWNTGATTACLNNIAAGNYNVTITDDNNCTQTETVNVTNTGATINANESSTNTNCGQSNGQACVAPTGGTAPYTYVWNTGATTACLNNIAAGNYNVTITDDNNCTQTETVNVANTGATILSNESSTNTNCGQSNGQACVAPTGGTAPYTYLWVNGATTACLNNIAAGNYNVTITDDNNCTQTETVNVANNGATILSNESSTNTNCGQSNGQACVAPSGGTAPYTYVWANGATTACLNNIAAGNYNVTITDDNNCTQTETVTVLDQSIAFSSNPSVTNNICGQSIGQACVAPTGGTAPYTYLWSNSQTSSCINNLSNGQYIVTITDQNGCSIIDTLNITDPSNFQATATFMSETCENTCDGSVLFQANGGANPIEYSIDDGLTYLQTAQFLNLCDGTYNLIVKDATGCMVENTIVLSPGAPILQPNILAVSPICISSSNILLQASISGGIFSGNGIISSLTGEFSPTTAQTGNHLIKYYFDNDQCSDTAYLTLSVIQSIQISTTDIELCDQNNVYTLQATPSGGIWQGPGISNASTGQIDLSLLDPGIHTYQYQISQACGDTASLNLTLLDNEVIQLVVDDTVCQNEPAFQLLSTNSNGIWAGTGVSGINPYLFNPSIAGIGVHTIYYTNHNLCQKTDSVKIQVFQAPQSTIITSPYEGCVPFTIEFNQSNNNLEEIKWYIDGRLVSTKANDQYTFVQAGTYTLTADVQNNVGCESNHTFIHPIKVVDGPEAEFSIEAIDGTMRYNFYTQTSPNDKIRWIIQNKLYETTQCSHDFKDTGSYNVCLYIESLYQCVDTNCALIEVKNPFFQVYIPNTFTPDEDQTNDVYTPILTDYDVIDYQFSIFNRWGDRVYSTNIPKQGWNGLHNSIDARQDIYTWKLEFIKPETLTHYSETGFVLLLR